MMRVILAFICAFGLSARASAEEQASVRHAKGPPDKDIQVGVYISVKPDCTSGPLPTIRLIGEPAHGKVTVKKANINATNVKQCLAIDVPGYIAFYRSSPGFSGADSVILELKYPGGKTEVQKITVTVDSANLGL